ncbi:hypothetical protein FGF1_14870 [Flavobacteriaceae bacterium GF1]
MRAIKLSVVSLLIPLFALAQTNTFPFPSTGSVGIGTTAPSSKLDIEQNHNSSTFVEITNTNTGNLARRGIATGNGTLGHTAHFFSTSANFDAVSTWASSGVLNTDSQLLNGLVLRTASGKIRFQPNGIEDKIVFSENGNVGIGSNNPNATLEISKNFDGSTSAYILNQNASPNSRAILLVGEQPFGGNYGYLAHHNSDYVGNWGDYTYANSTWLSASDVNGLNIIAGNPQGKIVFGTGTSEKMRLTTNGNLGIGTTDPDSKLAVNGNIHAKEVKVDLVGWPDYVFKKGYDLPSLAEVEQHIREKGHLINIPSATEVEENGLQLGEMNKLLLEKIEELTLYTLQQQEELEAQKLAYQELKEEFKNLKQLITNNHEK